MTYTIYNQNCYGLKEISDNSVDTIITDPPYGINLEKWDSIPNPSIWKDCYRVLKPGGFFLSFSSIKFQHIFTKDFLEAGFIFKDVLLWVYLNGRVPSIQVDAQIDLFLGNQRPTVGEYSYIQGSPNSHKKSSYTQKKQKTTSTQASLPWKGFGTGLKTAYEPIIMIQKPYEKPLAKNILSYGTGALDLEHTRIPYDSGEIHVGHNPHPSGRVMANIIQTDSFGDYQKFFFVGKVRDGKKTGNTHPTVKPQDLMQCLISLVSKENDTVLDPFMGSGSTGISALALHRNFIGYEKEKDYFKIAQQRILHILNKKS